MAADQFPRVWKRRVSLPARLLLPRHRSDYCSCSCSGQLRFANLNGDTTLMSRQKRQHSKVSGRLNTRQYRELFEECHDAMAIIPRDGTILDANPAASELFAWPHAEFLGMNIRSVYANPEDRARYQEQIERDGFVRDFEVVFVTRDGRRLDCLLTTVVRRAPDGSVSGYQGIVRDISERKRMQKELRQYYEQVRSMMAGFVAIEDRERRRIAVGLHDRVGQTLMASQMKIGVLRQAGGGRSGRPCSMTCRVCSTGWTENCAPSSSSSVRPCSTTSGWWPACGGSPATSNRSTDCGIVHARTHSAA